MNFSKTPPIPNFTKIFNSSCFHMQRDRWTDKHGEANTFLQLFVMKEIAINICFCTHIIWRLCVSTFPDLDTLKVGKNLYLIIWHWSCNHVCCDRPAGFSNSLFPLSSLYWHTLNVWCSSLSLASPLCFVNSVCLARIQWNKNNTTLTEQTITVVSVGNIL